MNVDFSPGGPFNAADFKVALETCMRDFGFSHEVAVVVPSTWVWLSAIKALPILYVDASVTGDGKDPGARCSRSK